MVNINPSGFAIWCYLSAIYFFGNGYLFYLFFVVVEKAVQYRSNVGWATGPLCA